MISLLLAICVGFQEPVSHEKPLQFSVTHDGAAGESLDGRLYIMLTRGKLPLIGGPNWFNPEPFFALDVDGWLANIPMLVGENADMMEDSIPSIPSGNWKAVAVFRKQNDRCKIASPGGLYGKAVSFEGSGMGAGHGRVFNVQVIREMDQSIAKRLNLPHLQFKDSKPIE